MYYFFFLLLLVVGHHCNKIGRIIILAIEYFISISRIFFCVIDHIYMYSSYKRRSTENPPSVFVGKDVRCANGRCTKLQDLTQHYCCWSSCGLFRRQTNIYIYNIKKQNRIETFANEQDSPTKSMERSHAIGRRNCRSAGGPTTKDDQASIRPSQKARPSRQGAQDDRRPKQTSCIGCVDGCTGGRRSHNW